MINPKDFGSLRVYPIASDIGGGIFSNKIPKGTPMISDGADLHIFLEHAEELLEDLTAAVNYIKHYMERNP